MKMKMKFLTAVLFGLILVGCSNGPDITDPEYIAKQQQRLKVERDSLMIQWDSLMQTKVDIPVDIDSTIFSPECLKQFNNLSRSTKGGLKVIANSKLVTSTITDIIETNVVDETDIMIIIDKTSSMADDLGDIKKSLSQIIDQLKGYSGVRLAVSTYGDKNIDGKLWYDYQNFETDYTETKNFINSIQMTHGGDFPESVYDGIHEAFQENFWNSSSKRIVILLGDAPSLGKGRSTYTEKDIIQLATENDINMNFYPIVLSPFNTEMSVVDKMQQVTLIDAIFPNPTYGPVNLILSKEDKLKCEVFNQSGKLVSSEEIESKEHNIDLSNYENGLFIIKISDEKKNYDSRKVILNK